MVNDDFIADLLASVPVKELFGEYIDESMMSLFPDPNK